MSKHVLITGATSGIGKSLAELYASKGYSVYACGRNKQKLDELKKRGGIIPLQFDQLNSSETKAVLGNLEPIDIAIFNAGDCEYIDDALHFDADMFKRVIDINLTSVGTLLQQVLPQLNRETDTAQLVLVGSSASMVPFTRAQAYGASKAGIAYLADSLYIDLKPQNIDVSLVLPGFIETPLTDKNDFNMPFLMSSDEAAERIYKGIAKRKRHIAFPKRLIWSLRFASCLPATWWRKIMLNSDQ